MTARCPECGAEFWKSLHGDARLLLMEDRTLHKIDLYRRNRRASIGLAILLFIGLINFLVVIAAVHKAQQPFAVAPIMLASGLGNVLFFTTMAFFFNARLRHAQSLRRYRAVIEELLHREGAPANSE